MVVHLANFAHTRKGYIRKKELKKLIDNPITNSKSFGKIRKPFVNHCFTVYVCRFKVVP